MVIDVGGGGRRGKRSAVGVPPTVGPPRVVKRVLTALVVVERRRERHGHSRRRAGVVAVREVGIGVLWHDLRLLRLQLWLRWQGRSIGGPERRQVEVVMVAGIPAMAIVDGAAPRVPHLRMRILNGIGSPRTEKSGLFGGDGRKEARDAAKRKKKRGTSSLVIRFGWVGNVVNILKRVA